MNEKTGPIRQEEKASAEENSVQICQTITVIRPQLLQARINGPHGIIAMGSSRGGTSTVSYLLYRAGIDMGRTRDLNFEDIDLVENLNNQEQLRTILERRESQAGEGKWGCKVPALTLQMEWLDRCLTAPIFVFVFRNPAAVARSIFERDPVYGKTTLAYINSIDHSMKFYRHFVQVAPKISAPIIVCEYEQARSRSGIFVMEMNRSLGLGLDAPTQRDIAVEIAKPGYKKKV